MRSVLIILSILTLCIFFASNVSAYRDNIINGTVFVIDNGNNIVFDDSVTIFLGENETFLSNIDLFNNYNLYHLYISQTPLPTDYYTILMNTIAPNPYYHKDVINALNSMLSGNASTYYLYTVSFDYSRVIGISISVNNTMPNINQVRLRAIKTSYDKVNELGIVVRWLHVKKVTASFGYSTYEKNYIISSLVTDGIQLLKFFGIKLPSIHVYMISDTDYYYLDDQSVSSSTEVSSFDELLPYLESGQVVYLYYNINPEESIYVEVVPVRILNEDIYDILQRYGDISNISVWGYAFYGDATSDGANDYIVTESDVDNVFHGGWMDLLLDLATFDGYMNLTDEQFSDTSVLLYVSNFTVNPGVGYIINWTYQNGVHYMAIYKKLSDGTYFTFKYALVYTPNYEYKALRVKDYSATTENDAFLQRDLIFTPYSYAPILYYNRDSVDRIEIYDTNSNLVMVIDGVTLRSPDVDINVIESFLEDSFYDNDNYTKMKIYYTTSPPSMSVVTKERPSLTNSYYSVKTDLYEYDWTKINGWFFSFYILDDFNDYGVIDLSSTIDTITPALVRISPLANPAEFLGSINYTTFLEYSDSSSVDNPYYETLSVIRGYTLSAYLQKMDRILMNNYDIGFYTYYIVRRGIFSYDLTEYFGYPYIYIEELNETSTDLSITDKNIYVPFYGMSQLTLENLLTYDITIDNITLYVNNEEHNELIIGNYSGRILPARGFININFDGFGMMAYSDPELTLDSFYRTRIVDPVTIRLVIDGFDPFGEPIQLTISSEIILIYVV